MLTLTAACMLTSTCCPVPVRSRCRTAVSAPRTANTLAVCCAWFPLGRMGASRVIVVSTRPHHPRPGEQGEVGRRLVELGARASRRE